MGGGPEPGLGIGNLKIFKTCSRYSGNIPDLQVVRIYHIPGTTASA